MHSEAVPEKIHREETRNTNTDRVVKREGDLGSVQCANLKRNSSGRKEEKKIPTPSSHPLQDKKRGFRKKCKKAKDQRAGMEKRGTKSPIRFKGEDLKLQKRAAGGEDAIQPHKNHKERRTKPTRERVCLNC